MRRVRYVVAMSLDGYIADSDDDYGWIPPDPAIDFQELFRPFDTVLVGRRSYEVARAGGHPIAFPGMRVYVFSEAGFEPDDPGVEVREDAAATVSELLEKPGEDLWLFGGGRLFRSLLEAGRPIPAGSCAWSTTWPRERSPGAVSRAGHPRERQRTACRNAAAQPPTVGSPSTNETRRMGTPVSSRPICSNTPSR